MGSNSLAASAGLYQRARRIMPGGATRVTIWWPPHPPYAVSGQGCRVTDADGRVFLDFSNNFFSLIHGHAHPAIVAAVQAQAARGMAFGLPTQLDVELAEAICGRGVPGLSQIRFCNSGSEAVMFAIKAARAATGRPKIAKMEGGYHGAYDHVEVSYDSGPANWGAPDAPARNAYTKGTPPGVLADTVVLPFNDLPASLALIEAHARDLAAVVLDPIPSRVGMVPGTPDYLQGLQAACRRHGILLILDEIICFRLHPQGAQTLFGLQPDFTTLGKIIGGGQPVGAVAGTRDAMAVFDASMGRPVVPHGGTFSANPITMAAGIASLRLLDAAAHRHLDVLGEAVRDRMRAAIAAAGVPGQVTGMGSLFRLHLHDRPIRTYRDAYPTQAESARQSALFGFLLAHGILTTPNISGALSTPMTAAEVEEFGAALDAGLRAIA
ncbi:aspartate aminotransferase family protein [Paracraurococcus ruber]|uniref:Aspartate aminotransferase family protein n=1 Tax=Paracraurococcus ruber TaxID=77675 RepID=A0ABS1CWW9_9PROT|nr:aspartate aminotransferase family protein [Paracraurococcus ruber]TDG33182.1 aspartate aminotransferase family protein [Paracraurococcus ruber]